MKSKLKRILPIMLAVMLVFGLFTAIPLTAMAATVNAPSNLNSTIAANGLKLTWNDNSNNEDGFAIYRKEAEGDFTRIGRVDSNITTYTDTTAVGGITYTYRCGSFIGGMTPVYSNEVTVQHTINAPSKESPQATKPSIKRRNILK